jgi:hypothetical protein
VLSLSAKSGAAVSACQLNVLYHVWKARMPEKNFSFLAYDENRLGQRCSAIFALLSHFFPPNSLSDGANSRCRHVSSRLYPRLVLEIVDKFRSMTLLGRSISTTQDLFGCRKFSTCVYGRCLASTGSRGFSKNGICIHRSGSTRSGLGHKRSGCESRYGYVLVGLFVMSHRLLGELDVRVSK